MQTCVSLVRSYLEEQTDGLLKKKSPNKMPIVGESPLIKLIVDGNKANFIIEAHTGAGKTTLGLTLYHKALFGQLPGYRVVYINTRGLLEALGRDNYEAKLLTAIFDHDSQEHKNSERYIYTSSHIIVKCKSFEECLKEYSSRYPNERLIVVLDELERVLDWKSIETLVKGWFVATRKFYDEYGKVWVKLVVPLPRVLGQLQSIMDTLKRESEAAYVFTESRSLDVDESILWNYVSKLNRCLEGCLREFLTSKDFRRLIRTLSYLKSGRLAFPILWNVLSDAICYALKGSTQVQGLEKIENVEEQVKRVECRDFPGINVDKYVDPVIVGIAEGKLFRGERRQVINMWEGGFRYLCKELGYKLSPHKLGYQDFICYIDNTAVWMTLKKEIKVDDLREIGGYVYKILRGTTNLKVLALVPTFTRGSSDKRVAIEAESKERGRRMPTSVTITFDYRILTVEELLAIAHMGYKNLNLDTHITDSIIRELMEDIRTQIRWG